MRDLLIRLVLALIVLPATSLVSVTRDPAATVIRYVDADASGGDGTTWDDAYRYLQDALDAANADGATDYEIWVAAGVYYPDEDSDGGHVSDAVTETFTLRYDNVQLYGGFDPQSGADEWSERDWESHVTVLSGDIAQDDITDANGVITTTAHISGTNAYHVLWLDGVTNEPISTTTCIDGFTITAGQANGSYPHDRSGGLYCAGSGSGHGCSPTLTNVTFSGNQAGYGGGMFNDGYSGTSSPVLTNVILWGNSGAQIQNYYATPVVNYSLVQGGHAGTGNIDAAPQFVTPITATAAPTTTGNYRLLGNSPAIDAGDNGAVPAGVTTDLAGDPRFIDHFRPDSGSGSPPIVDMGAYETPNTIYLPLVLRNSDS